LSRTLRMRFRSRSFLRHLEFTVNVANQTPAAQHIHHWSYPVEKKQQRRSLKTGSNYVNVMLENVDHLSFVTFIRLSQEKSDEVPEMLLHY